MKVLMRDTFEWVDVTFNPMNNRIECGNSKIADNQILSIKDSAYATNKVFDGIQQQMEEIVAVVAQLKSIASSTTMLSLVAVYG